MTRIAEALSFVLITALVPATAHAVTCNVTGTVKIDALDSYFCKEDPDGPGGATQDCSNWNETDLDTTTKPMKYIRLKVTNSTNSNDVYDNAFTDASGNFTATWTDTSWSSCTGHSVDVVIWFQRVHEDDTGLNSNWRTRFRVVQPGGGNTTWTHAPGSNPDWSDVALTGSTTPVGTKTFARDPNTGGQRRQANIYYTANSAITEIVAWTNNLSAEFAQTGTAADGTGPMRIVYDAAAWTECGGSPGACAYQDTWHIELDEMLYNNGGVTRHEVGHLVHAALHNRKRCVEGVGCVGCNSNGLNGTPGTPSSGCEWGYHAVVEGLATFFATRSITENDTNAWWCNCADDDLEVPPSELDPCSEEAVSGHDSDRIDTCGSDSLDQRFDGWRGIGDDYVTARSHCVRLVKCLDLTFDGDCVDPADILYGCYSICTDTDDDGDCDVFHCPDVNPADYICDDYQDLGWRNAEQVVRFMWDMIDFNNEGGTYPDDSNFNATTISDVFEDMKCLTGSGDYGGDEDGCNEPNRFTGGTCSPSSGLASVCPGTQSATRDSYNTWDLAYAIPDTPTPQSDERSLNCVDDAED